MGRTACTEPQCPYKGALYLYLTVELYLYSPYGPYGLYRTSRPVQGCTLPLPKSRAIPLLPLWAVRPVRSLSACTRVHFTLPFSQYCYVSRQVLCDNRFHCFQYCNDMQNRLFVNNLNVLMKRKISQKACI